MKPQLYEYLTDKQCKTIVLYFSLCLTMYSIYYVVNKEMSAQIYEQQYADMKQIYMRLCEMDVDP